MSDPFKIDSHTCISFSGGRTSAYMLWRVLQSNGGLPPEAIVCFANTGKEEEATLRFVRDCGLHWNVPIFWVEYRNDDVGYAVVDFDTASRNGEPFEAIINQRGNIGGSLPSPIARYCSSELKTRTMKKYLRFAGFAEWDTFCGIRADEPRRVAKFRGNPNPEGKHETLCIPLADSNISSQDVGQFWRSNTFDLELPNLNGKTIHGNCDLCFLKTTSAIISLIAEKPNRAMWWAEQEKRAESRTNGNGSRFRIDRPNYAAMLKNASDQADAFGYDAEEEAIPCFCGD